jgi:DNA-binding NarL/FixJ family response regulator
LRAELVPGHEKNREFADTQAVDQNGHPIRLVIADDEEDIRGLLTAIIESEPSLELVGSASDTEETIRIVGEEKPDVAIVDWVMPGGGGGRAAGEIKAQDLPTRIIAYTGADASQASYDMMTAGAVSFLQKGCTKEELVEAIKGAMRW